MLFRFIYSLCAVMTMTGRPPRESLARARSAACITGSHFSRPLLIYVIMNNLIMVKRTGTTRTHSLYIVCIGWLLRLALSGAIVARAGETPAAAPHAFFRHRRELSVRLVDVSAAALPARCCDAAGPVAAEGA